MIILPLVLDSAKKKKSVLFYLIRWFMASVFNSNSLVKILAPLLTARY